MQDDFDLEVVLSVLTGINISNYTDIYNFFCFLFEDEATMPEDIYLLRPVAIKHILRIQPQLANIKFTRSDNLYDWLRVQKVVYGDTITISVIGEDIVSLKKQPHASEK